MDKDTILYIVTLSSFAFGAFGWLRSGKKDARTESANFAEMRADIRSLLTQMAELKGEIKALQDGYINQLTINVRQNERLDRVSERVDKHGRELDDLRVRVNGGVF